MRSGTAGTPGKGSRKGRVMLAPSIIERFRDVTAKRLGLQLRAVQIEAAKHLLSGSIAEMQTGEGKTLSVALAATTLALKNIQVLVVTANDYLANRDADWMAPIYSDLGLEVSSVSPISTVDERQSAYHCNIVYGTIREFAFDDLRRSIIRRQQPSASFKAWCRFEAMIVDEADSVLIDEARTPLVINSPVNSTNSASEACFRWCADFVRQFQAPSDYAQLPGSGSIALTDLGRHRMFQAVMPPELRSLTTTEIEHGIELAIWVNNNVQRDVHYIVSNGQIELVDEYTGRRSTLRSFSGGIQQAIEARESLSLTPPFQNTARTTVQDFVAKFKHLSGITATAWEDRLELQSIYSLPVRQIPEHAPSQRTTLEPIVARTKIDKYQRIATETLAMIAVGRPVLVGTRTVAHSIELSMIFHFSDIEHSVLNAQNPQFEAELIARAGSRGRVTIATNMAGRGTDIPLDADVAAVGGLHVIVCEPHSASRIDRQLMGRCGRQGSPGTTRLYVCPEDSIFEQAFGVERVEKLFQFASKATDQQLLRTLRRAQRRVAHLHRQERARLTAHESRLASSLQQLGLDPNLDPIPSNVGSVGK